jgi:hypothetical protein
MASSHMKMPNAYTSICADTARTLNALARVTRVDASTRITHAWAAQCHCCYMQLEIQLDPAGVLLQDSCGLPCWTAALQAASLQIAQAPSCKQQRISNRCL